MTRTLADWFFLRAALLATQPFHCLLPLEEGVGTPFELLSEGHQSHPQRLPQDSSPPRWATSDPLSWVLGFQYVNLRSTQTSKPILGVGISTPLSTSKANPFWSFLLSPSTHCYHCQKCCQPFQNSQTMVTYCEDKQILQHVLKLLTCMSYQTLFISLPHSFQDLV